MGVRFTKLIGDFLLGLCTILARGAIIGLSTTAIADGHIRIVAVQLVAVAVSFLHFCIRQMRHEKTRSALAHLGGSTAIIDAVSAVMLSFADVPLQSSSYETFGVGATSDCDVTQHCGSPALYLCNCIMWPPVRITENDVGGKGAIVLYSAVACTGG